MNQYSLFLIKITPFYYGWIILLSSGIATIAACAAAALTLSVFVTPMANELGWSRTLIIGAPTIAGLIAITLAPISGWVIDRKGDKFVLSISLLIMGISLIFLNYWITPLSFYILFGIARLLFVAPIMNSGTTVVSRWFIRRRGRANGISILITSIGMGLIPVYSQFLIDTVGWREAWLWLGVTVWIIGAIPSLLFIISKPEWTPNKKGKVLLWSEQGIGDEILFASLIPELVEKVDQLAKDWQKELEDIENNFKECFAKATCKTSGKRK